MSEFMNSDGSGLVGGQLPSTIGKALQLDSSGNLLCNIAAGSSSGTQYTDGAAAPTHPVGNEIVFNKAGTMTAVSDTNGLPINGSITATNPSVGTDGAAIPTSSTLIGASDGSSNLAQLLVESASNHNLRTALYNAGNELAIDASGRITLVPNSSVNVAQIAGVAPGLDNTNELRTSIYGKNAAAGDTPLSVDSAGRITSLLQVVGGTALAADQSNSILRVSLYGKNAAAGDNVISTDGSGRLQTANYIGGSAVGRDNPYPSADQIRLWIANGQGFGVTSGKQTAAGAITAGFSLFNPNGSGKNIILFSLKWMVGNTSFTPLYIISTDVAGWTSLTASIFNRKAGSGTASIATSNYNNTNVTPAGNQADITGSASNAGAQQLQDGDAIYIPPNQGIALHPSLTSANSWFVAAAWVEI
jgi:hypothetical protein